MSMTRTYNVRKMRRARRVRARIRGTAERPRLSVFRSNKHVFLQLIDDEHGTTLCSVSTYANTKKEGKTDAARRVGGELARLAKQRGIAHAVLDRGPRRYHGRIKAVGEGARTEGLAI
jgi:large subunit ribosomal protein L18